MRLSWSRIKQKWARFRENRQIRKDDLLRTKSTRRLKVNGLHYPDLKSFQDGHQSFHVNINPGFQRMGVYRIGERGLNAKYEAWVQMLKGRPAPHEVGHVYQSIFHDRRGFKLNPDSSLASMDDAIIRVLGFGLHVDANPFSPRVRKIPAIPFSEMGKFGVIMDEVARHFSTPKAFFRAVARMYHEPSLEGAINRLNVSHKSISPFTQRREKKRNVPLAGMSLTHDAAVRKVLDFFEAYVKKYPQK